MKITRFIVMASLLVANANAAFAQPGGFQAKTTTFKKEVFEQSLVGAVGPNVVGYQFVLIKDGRLVSERFGGKARRGADGDMDMTATTPINIGSLQKFITGTAMINLMENPAVYSPDRNQSLAVRLKRPMTTLFPSVWLKGMKTGIEKITLGQLLQHRSGFNGYDSKDGELYKESNRNVLGFLRDADGFLPERYD